MKNPWILPATALAVGAFVGALGGFIAGKTSSPADVADKAEESPQQRTRSQGRPATAGNESKRSGTRAKSTDEIYRAPGQSNRIQALADFYSGLSPAQLAAEAAKLEDLPMSERMVASFLLFGKWAETDPLAALAYTSKMGIGGNFVKSTILQSWASVDPAAAAKYYSENARDFGMMGGGPVGGSNGAGTIAGEWARQDPVAAMAWASTLSGSDKSSAMGAVVREVAASDPAKAWGMVATMDKNSQGRAYDDIAAKWGSKDFTQAEAMIRSLPADHPASALASAISSLSKSDPKTAAAKAAAMPAGNDRISAVADVAQNWSCESPKEAAAWLVEQGEDAANSRNGIGSVVSIWVSQDPKGALAFVNSQPEGAVRDSAALAYVMSNSKAAPAESIKVAETISDEDNRNRAVMITAGRWLQEDRAAANDYIQNSDDFSDEEKAEAAER
jgi:hypothetical protein